MTAEQTLENYGYNEDNRFDDCNLTWDTVLSILSGHSALKEQEVVAWLCEKLDEKLVTDRFFTTQDRWQMETAKDEGYTITELVKK